MRILLVHNFYLQPGGEDEVFVRERNLLRKKGHQIIEYTSSNADILRNGSLTLLKNTIWNRSVHERLRRLIKHDSIDIVHFHNTFPLISPSAYYAASSEGIPVIQTLHNYRLLCPAAIFFRDGHVCESCVGKNIPWPGIIHRCYRQSLASTVAVSAMLTTHRWLKTWGKKVSAYIAPTQFARSKFIEGGLSADRIRVKPHFLDHDPGVGRGEGHFAIFVGRLSQEKGLGLLLKAWEELDGTIQLIIVGDGPLAPMVEEAAGYDTTIRWLGRKNKSETYKLIGSASCLIFPSEVYETFGLTIIEAYAGGTPVIASDVGAAAELVRNGQTGFHFRNGSVDDLVRKTRFFFENSNIGAEMRQNARTEYELKYSAERNYSSLMEIYNHAFSLK